MMMAAELSVSLYQCATELSVQVCVCKCLAELSAEFAAEMSS